MFLHFDSVALPSDRLGDEILKVRCHVVFTLGMSKYRIMCHFTNMHTYWFLYYQGTMAPRRKSAIPCSSPTSSQLKGNYATKSSFFKVQIQLLKITHIDILNHIQLGSFYRKPLHSLNRRAVDPLVVRNRVESLIMVSEVVQILLITLRKLQLHIHLW